MMRMKRGSSALSQNLISLQSLGIVLSLLLIIQAAVVNGPDKENAREHGFVEGIRPYYIYGSTVAQTSARGKSSNARKILAFSRMISSIDRVEELVSLSEKYGLDLDTTVENFDPNMNRQFNSSSLSLEVSRRKLMIQGIHVGHEKHHLRAKRHRFDDAGHVYPPEIDMAVLIAYFNPIGYMRPLMNVLYVINKLKRDGYPVFVAEAALDGFQFTLSPSLRAVSAQTDSVLFYKENLYNMLEKVVPKTFKKLVFVDCDVDFASQTWYRDTSRLLDTHDVVQPFHVAWWLNINYTTVLRERPSYLYVSSNLTEERRQEMVNLPASHEGFAWAFRRQVLHAMGGMPDFAVLTGGDTIVALAVSPMAIRTRFFLFQLPYLRRSVQLYNKRAQSAFDVFGVNPGERTCGYTPGAIRHLYHGSRSRRKYDMFEVHKLFTRQGFSLNDTYKDATGLYRYTSPSKWNRIFIDYLYSRLEDEST